MNWKVPSITQHPPFKQMVLGLKFPNMVELVLLDRIDENGPVFVSARSKGLIAEFANIFNLATEKEETLMKIDMYSEMVLPTAEVMKQHGFTTPTEEKTSKAKDTTKK